jgi:nucleoside 2-deoxyribosyltransferase
LFKNPDEVQEISKKDILGLKECDVLIGVLNGICVGAGTAWEMGYFHALGKKVIGLKTDRKVADSISDISVVITGAVHIVESLEELEEELKKIKTQ